MTSSMPYDATHSVAGDAVLADARRTGRLLWWLAVAGAVASIVLGVVVVAWPRATLHVGAVLFGLWLLVHGIVYIVDAITDRSADAGARALSGVLGLLFVVAGVICLRNLLVSLLTVATIIGVSWLIAGIVGVVAAFGDRYAGGARWWVAALGVITALGGLVVLVWPGPSLATIVYFTGIWLIVMGIIEFFLVIRNRPAH